MTGLLLALVIALVLASILTWPMGRRPGRAGSAAAGWLFAFLVLVPLVWLAALWLPATGPVHAGVAWLPPLLVGVLLVLLLAASAPSVRPPRDASPRAGERMPPRETPGVVLAAVFVDVMFWVFLAAAVALLVTTLVA